MRLAGLGTALLTSLVALVISLPALAAPSEFELRSAFGPDGTEATAFSSDGSVAVDQTADTVYVIDQDADSLYIYKFDLEGNPVPFGGSEPYIEDHKIGGPTFLAGTNQAQVAVDETTHEFYVTTDNSVTAFQANGEPANFSAGPGMGTNAIGGFTRLIGVAVDAEGAIYAADADAGGFGVGVVKIFAPSGEEITHFDAPEASKLAVDSNGAVYVQRFFNILKYTPSVFPVIGATEYTAAVQPLNADGEPFAVAVDRSTNEVYVGEINRPIPYTSERRIAVYDEDGNLVMDFAGPGEEGAVKGPYGVAIDEATGTVFVDDFDPVSSLAQVKVFGSRTFFEGKPTVESTVVADVTADSLTFVARINPNTAPTTYRFEYGTEDCELGGCASVPLGGGQIAAGHDAVTVSHPITGLEPGTTYHYRVVADNTVVGDPRFGETESPDRTFTTQVTGVGFQLPDRRVWEMVSPPDKHGARILEGFLSGHVQAAADGDGLTYISAGSITGEPQGMREGSSVLSRRDAAGTWTSEDITTPNDSVAPPALGRQSEYKLFDLDLSEALLEQRTDTPLSPDASPERTIYLRQNTRPPLYRPLLTVKEGFANVPPGTNTADVDIRAATPDLDRVLLRSTDPLVASGTGGLYGWSDGHLERVAALPDADGGAMVVGVAGSDPQSVRRAISDDGSRIFWTSSSPKHLYMREMEMEETVQLDLPQPGASEAGAAEPRFQGASADGDVVFFTDTHQLTADASPTGADLYRCEIPIGDPLSGCTSLIDLSAPLPESGESAEVLGTVPGLSDDGTRAYFVAKGVLDTEPNQSGDTAQADEPNLYLWRQGEGIRFIATLAAADDANWGKPEQGAPAGLVSSLSAMASPSGRYLAFASERSLAGEESEDASSDPVVRVFRYDAVAERLECVSCDPTGAAPTGRIMPKGGKEAELIDFWSLFQSRLVAAVLPEPTKMRVEGNSIYRTRAVHDNGRVFFNAVDSLVPADSNGQWDVYQHEPTGVGSCEASSGDGATSRSGQGCVSLISSGTSDRPSGFFDASADGEDVFFLTSARLSVLDEDGEADVYDARVDGVAATLRPSPECLGEACQPPALAPEDPTPGTATFRGQGNAKPKAAKRCPKGKRRARRKGNVRCVPRKRHSQRNRRARSDRRAAR